MAKRDYYDLLGVQQGADDAELKKAFRDKARRHHPDLNPDDSGAEKLFKQINEAYAVLSDAKLRARYDRHGHAGLDEENLSGITIVMEAIDDLFGDIGRKWRERIQKRRGRDLRYTLEVSLPEAVHGVSKEIKVETSRGTKTFEVRVKPGTKSGAVEVIRGEGNPGASGGPPGDLAVVIRVREDKTLSREGFNILSEATVAYHQAVLGDSINIITVDGPVRMKIPAGTPSGKTFRVRNHGIPKTSLPGANRGDHLVTINIDVPSTVTPEQEKILRAFAATLTGTSLKPSKATTKLKGKIRSLLDD